MLESNQAVIRLLCEPKHLLTRWGELGLVRPFPIYSTNVVTGEQRFILLAVKGLSYLNW